MTATAPRLIVGIGASAGGLEAITTLLSALPGDTGMSFVIVTHMPRHRDSHLSEILRRHTTLRVEDAADGRALEPNVIYVAPPDCVVEISDFHLVCKERNLHPMHKPIDVFFSALALHSAEEAIAIVLSGGGNDGTLGIKAVKERGGMTLAQGGDGNAPQHPSMPDAAIASGNIDLVLPAQEIGPRLAQYAAYYPQALTVVVDTPTGHEAIYDMLRKEVGHDFSGYKPSTFYRRVLRRMHLTHMADLDAYVALLRRDPSEVTLLFRELLIGVTSFFRDADAFETLAQQVIPQIISHKEPNEAVRVWVPGCATGEEAYSIAILIREYLDTVDLHPQVQIFASDIDEQALAAARHGRYPAALMESVSPERRERFFVDDGVSFVVCKEIREMCVFSAQSVLRDPPFSRIDLVSCRNLLIYLGVDFQSQVMPIFHFALRPQGYLFLGVSENISQHTDLFAAIDRKQRIFQKRDHVTTRLNLPRTVASYGAAGPLPRKPVRENVTVADNVQQAVDRLVLERHAPAHVVVNRDGDIVLYSRRTGRFLESASGAPSRQLLTQARRGLKLELRAALQDALASGRRARRAAMVGESDGKALGVDIVVEPFGENSKDPLFLVVFEEKGDATDGAAASLASGDDRLAQVEAELRDTRERLQSEIEEHEAALEELKSSTEELQSVNEELQSSNEELESSKEELQSVNEELLTINAELNSKIEALDQVNADLANVLDSTKVATIFLDRTLAVRNFTPAATEIYNLISADTGRRLTDIACKLQESDLQNDMSAVLSSGKMVERTVRRADGSASFLMRVLPHRSAAGHFDGILATFVNVSSVPEIELRQRVLIEELNHRVRNMLTVVTSIANQTLRQTTTKEDFVAAFTGRIQAMGAAYTLVAESKWGEVSLKTVLLEQIRPFAEANAQRLVLSGPEVRFSPSAALSFSLVVHELVVNAAKYGALSNATGQVALDWKVESGQLVVSWREQGGPPVVKPERRGFGSELVQREITSRLGGVLNVEYLPTGLVASIAIPIGGDLVKVAAETGVDE